jgi:predicted neutral ceramidase superfamily lipid hydrolase
VTTSGPRDTSAANKLIVAFFVFAAWFFVLGIFSSSMTFTSLLDFMIVGIIALVMIGLSLYVILILLLITITNITIQLFLIFFIVANMIYIVFYLGVYTACIDQARDEGISSEEYIKDFNMQAKSQGKVERGFLLKGKHAAGGTTDA